MQLTHGTMAGMISSESAGSSNADPGSAGSGSAGSGGAGSRSADPGGALDRALVAVGDRWSLLVVQALLSGPLRFGQLAEAVGGIAPNVLTARLRHLEREGLVAASPYSHRPVRLNYELTGTGHELAGALALLTSWGARRQGGEEPRHHELCGTPVEARWFCPTCDRLVVEGEADGLHHV